MLPPGLRGEQGSLQNSLGSLRASLPTPDVAKGVNEAATTGNGRGRRTVIDLDEGEAVSR